MNQANQAKEVDSLRRQMQQVKREGEDFEQQLKRAQKEEEEYALTFYKRIADVDRKAVQYSDDKKYVRILEERRHLLTKGEREQQNFVHDLAELRKEVRLATENHISKLKKKISDLEEISK